MSKEFAMNMPSLNKKCIRWLDMSLISAALRSYLKCCLRSCSRYCRCQKGKTAYSTDQKLSINCGQHPIIELIERTREWAKLKNTYVDTLPLLADKHDRIHTTFNQDVAATGRLSSTHPNLQNIPVRTDLGRRIREAFIPKKGHVLVGADYSQFELRLAAVLADDKELIEDFNRRADIHTKTAAQVYGIDMDKVTKAQSWRESH